MSIQLYSLVHWEDPMDMTQVGSPISGVPSSTKEGTLQYRSGTTYLGKEQWKSCYLILRYGQVKHVSWYQYVPLNTHWLVSNQYTVPLTLVEGRFPSLIHLVFVVS